MGLTFWGMNQIADVCHRVNVVAASEAVLFAELTSPGVRMPPPPTDKARELDPPGPLRWPADPGDYYGLDHGGMKLSEHYNDGHKPQGALDQETGALGVSHEALVAGFRRWPADLGNDSGLDNGGMKLSEHHNDGHKPQGAPHQETGALGVSHEGLVALVGGSAVAAGQDTLTTGLAQNFAEDGITYSIARGNAIFEASAHSSEPGGAVAAADTFLVVSHADFIIENEWSHWGHGPNDAWASSELDYVAIDIKGWSPPGGTVVIDLSQWLQPCGHDPPHGNYADVMAMAEAHGAGSLSATLTNALTFENHFSFVNAIGMVAV